MPLKPGQDAGDRLKLDLAFGALQHRQDLFDVIVVAELAKCANQDSVRLRVLSEHSLDLGQCLGATDFGERIYRAFANPPV